MRSTNRPIGMYAVQMKFSKKQTNTFLHIPKPSNRKLFTQNSIRKRTWADKKWYRRKTERRRKERSCSNLQRMNFLHRKSHTPNTIDVAIAIVLCSSIDFSRYAKWQFSRRVTKVLWNRVPTSKYTERERVWVMQMVVTIKNYFCKRIVRWMPCFDSLALELWIMCNRRM